MTAVVDHEASEIDVARLRRHLAGCPACSQMYDRQVAVARAVRGAPRARPPRRLAGPHLRRLLIAATLVAIAIAAILLVTVGR